MKVANASTRPNTASPSWIRPSLLHSEYASWLHSMAYATQATKVAKKAPANVRIARTTITGETRVRAAVLNAVPRSFPLLPLPVPPHAPREQGADEPGSEEHHFVTAAAL